MASARLYDLVDSPIGDLLLVGDGESLCGLFMQDGDRPHAVEPGWTRSSDAFGDARSQLREYFAGERRVFDLPLELAGTPFQLRVWEALREIPYGATRTYAEQARSVGRPTAVRAVGAANGRNPIALVVPCHRVIGHDGGLTGFGGGIERKRFLLEREAAVVAPQLFERPHADCSRPAAATSADRRCF